MGHIPWPPAVQARLRGDGVHDQAVQYVLNANRRCDQVQCIHIKTVLLFVVYGSTTVLATLSLPSIKSYKDLLDSVTNKTNNRSVSCAQVCLLQPDEPGD